MSKYRLMAIVSLVVWSIVTPTLHADTVTLFVSQSGNDTWSGRFPDPNESKTDGPFASLERARDEVRRIRQMENWPDAGIKVTIRGGVYYLDKPLELSASDSGTETAPIVYEAYPGEEVRLSGGKPVTGFQSVSDSEALPRLEESAQGNIYQTDLKALGLTDYGEAHAGGAELFFCDEPMTLARWPNEGFVRIADIVVEDGHAIHGHKGSQIGQFRYSGDRPSRWIGEKDPWLHGYWFWDWSDQRQKIVSIDAAQFIISLATPYHTYGYRKNQWYYAFNMLSELDSPAEWYIDRERGLLYFWPPSALDGATVTLSVLPRLIVTKNASHIAFRGIVLEAARDTGVVVEGGKGILLADCVLRNLGGWGARLSGEEHGVMGCELYRTGGGGFALSGGDRKTLAPGGLYAENNEIHHYGRINRMYTPGISLDGVGNRAAHNLIHTAPHMAIQFGGNEHLIEYNEIHHVCMESNDAGAIYAGRNWTMRGHQIRFNYLHQITGFEERGCVGVYLDDMFASAAIYGNVFYNVTRAAFIGGGRDCTVENNLFIDCFPALHVDARALGWAGYHADEWIAEATEKGTLQGIAYTKPPYSERYPPLVNILDENPKAPVGNVIARNICWGGKWDDVEKKALPFLTFEDNLIGEDPLLVDKEKQDFRFRPESPAFKMGFQVIPIEKIGLKTRTGSGEIQSKNKTQTSSVSWKHCLKQRKDWYRSEEAIRIAENVLLFQLDNGGWPKNADMAVVLSDEEREKLHVRKSDIKESTIDNGATYTQLTYLAKTIDATGQERYKESFSRGLDFLLDSQYENGGWPQFPANRKGYYAHITFNDNAMIGVMRLLDAILREEDYSFTSENYKKRIQHALDLGIDCILKCQITVDGKRTVWCAQHDEKTLKPAPARAYEKISQSGAESVGIVRFLMGIENPSPDIIDAVQAAVQWFEKAKLNGIRVEEKAEPSLPKGHDRVVVSDPSAPPLWARFYEIGTNRPIFCGRDGNVKYSLAEIEHERRVGYSWYTNAPADLLAKDYPAWRSRWIQP